MGMEDRSLIARTGLGEGVTQGGAAQRDFGVRELFPIQLWSSLSGHALGRVQAEGRWQLSLLKDLLPRGAQDQVKSVGGEDLSLLGLKGQEREKLVRGARG